MVGTWNGGGTQVFLTVDIIQQSNGVGIFVSLPSEDKYLLKPFKYLLDLKNRKIEFVIFGISFKLRFNNITNNMEGKAVFIGSCNTNYQEEIVLKKISNTPICEKRNINRFHVLKQYEEYGYEKQGIEYKYNYYDKNKINLLKREFPVNINSYQNDYIQLLAIILKESI